MGGVGRTAPDAEDEESTAPGPNGNEFPDAFFAIVGIDLCENLGGFLEVLGRVGHERFGGQ
jgi:hypothetical protein